MIYTLGDQVPRIDKSAFIAPDATVIGDVILAKQSSIWFNVVLRGDIETIEIGEGSNIQDGSVLHTDPNNPCVVGKHVTVGHMAMLHGCRIGDRSLIGIGATLLNGSEVGENCIVGAHALITENKKFPDNVVIMGTPAKVVREVNDEDRKKLQANADRYVKRAGRYNAELKETTAN